MTRDELYRWAVERERNPHKDGSMIDPVARAVLELFAAADKSVASIAKLEGILNKTDKMLDDLQFNVDRLVRLRKESS